MKIIKNLNSSKGNSSSANTKPINSSLEKPAKLEKKITSIHAIETQNNLATQQYILINDGLLADGPQEEPTGGFGVTKLQRFPSRQTYELSKSVAGCDLSPKNKDE